jgi:hypothetical protein
MMLGMHVRTREASPLSASAALSTAMNESVRQQEV